MVPAPQGLEDREANLLAAHLGAFEAQTFLDLNSDLLERAKRERPVLGGGLHACDELGALEGLSMTRPLHHDKGHFLEPLVGSEAAATSKALPATPNGCTVF
jgi:hypothetical protein